MFSSHREREDLVAHRRAKLTVLGRRLLVDRIVVDGIAVAHAADMVGVQARRHGHAGRYLRHTAAPARADTLSAILQARRCEAIVPSVVPTLGLGREGPPQRERRT